jgi:hypothetical protein
MYFKSKIQVMTQLIQYFDVPNSGGCSYETIIFTK